MTPLIPLGRPSRRRPLVCSLLLLLSMAAAASAGDLEEVHARGALRMVTMPQQNSYFARVDLDVLRQLGIPLAELRSPRYFEGTDVELMKAFADWLGVELQVVPVTTAWADLIPTLLEGAGDVVAASLTITPERLAQVAFSEPYMTSYVVVAAPRELALKVAVPSDLAGKRGAVMRGSSQLEFARRLLPEAELLLTDFAAESYAAVSEGEADFMLLDSAAAIGESPELVYPDLQVALRLQEFRNAFAVRRDSNLVEPLNRWLSEVSASGELDRVFQREGVLGIATEATANGD